MSFSCRSSNETSLILLDNLSDALSVSQFPQFAARCWLKSVIIFKSWILILELSLFFFLCSLIPLDSGRESYHVLNECWGIFRLHIIGDQSLTWQILVKIECTLVAKCLWNSIAANSTLGDLLWRDGNHLTGNDIIRHHIERLEQVSIILAVSLLDVIHKNLFFLWILLEVVPQLFVRHKLFLELENLLLIDSLVSQMVNNALNSRLDFTDLMPNHRQASQHSVITKVLGKLLLE